MVKYLDCKNVLTYLLLFTLLLLTCSGEAARAVRQKSSVVLVFNNIAATRYDDKLSAMALERLQKKLEGIYIEIDAEPYVEDFKDKSFEKAAISELMTKVEGSGADYFVYAELQPFVRSESADLIYYNKGMEAALVLRIVDLKNAKELYNKKYVMKAEDSTDYFFIGSGSVAKKALDSVLFRAGEAISINLPL